MDVFRSERHKKVDYRIAHFIFWPLVIVFVAQAFWQPHIDHWRCKRIASELEQQYGLVVRFGDPSEFFVPPLKAQKENPDIGFSIGHADEHSALTALKGIRAALHMYPKELIKKYLSAVFVTGKIIIRGVEGGGTYFNSWIYIAALEEFEQIGTVLYEQNFHHELSSLFLKKNNFPKIRWHLANPPGFKYLPSKIDVIHAASEKLRRDPKEASLWFENGFVSDYGMSSMENDFNVYAALAMTHPDVLRNLMEQYSRIKAKSWILVDFYSSLAPELGAYLASVGLTERPGLSQVHQK